MNLRAFYKGSKVIKLMRLKLFHEYMDSLENFEETKLPPKNAFYSELDMKGIIDEDYKHAQQVCNTMEKKAIGCYHDVDLKTDVFLLAGVFQTFQNMLLKSYNLDATDLYTSPRLVWQTFDCCSVLWAWWLCASA